MNKLEYLLDLYETERFKKEMYSSDIMSDKPKQGKEKQYAAAVENLAVLEELIHEQEKHDNQKGLM